MFAIAAVIVLMTAGIAVVSVPGMSKQVGGLFATRSRDVIVYPIKPISLDISVSERGQLESSKNQVVSCEVEGSTTIITIVPEGTRVKKGDLVCELDSATLRDNLTNQKISTQEKDAAYQNAKLTREVAEISVTEYIEGTYKQERATMEGDISLATSDLVRADDRVIWATKMYEKGYVSKAQKVSEELTRQQAFFKKEQSESKLKVLEKYTKPKTIKDLTSEVEKAKSDELAKQQTFELEKSKEAKLERQIAKCKLYAPSDGLVVYANDTGRMFGSNQPQIEEGATVRERQAIFSLPDVTKMQVNTKVHESQIHKIEPGQRARIRIEAFAEQELAGTVLDVAPLADASSWLSSDVKVYSTHVRIDGVIPGIKPGMTANVEIMVDKIENALCVPVNAILPIKNKEYITIKHGDSYDRTEVVLGKSDDKFIEILKGVKEGDLAVLNPTSLMSEDEKRELFGTAGKPVYKRDLGKGEVGAAVPGAPGADTTKGQAETGRGAESKAKGKGKGNRKGGAGGGGMMNPAFREKFQKISPEDRDRMKSASEEERGEILKNAGFTDEEIGQMKQMRGNRGGGRGPGGGGEGGRGPGGGDGGRGDGTGGPRP